MRIPFTLATLVVLAAVPATAQTDSGEQDPPRKIREVYKAVDEVPEGAFDPAMIDGEFVRPTGIRLTGRHDDAFASMIDERVHFKRELAKSIGVGIKRSKAAETTPK